MSDSIVVEESNGEVIVIEPTVTINQTTCAAEWGGISGNIGNQTDLVAELATKQDKEEGKGLSTNDYTTPEKDKLAGIEAGAQVNVAPTWNSVTDKPSTFPPSSHDHSHNDLTGLNDGDYQHITLTEKTKLGLAPVINPDLSAPTTATVGKRNDIIFDTAGNEWKCLNTPMTTWNQTVNYIWALADKDVYPNLNTEYISHYDPILSKLIYKLAYAGTTPANLTMTQYVPNIASSAICTNIAGWIDYSATERFFAPAYALNGTTRAGMHTQTIASKLTLMLQLILSTIQSKPFTAIITYYKV